MNEYYHYTSETKVSQIMSTGMFSSHPLYTTNQFYSALEAGQALGVMEHNIDCVLLFKDDGLFRIGAPPTVPETGRFKGGGTQFQHPGRPRPIAKRGIGARGWTSMATTTKK
jgi:hypothetical protein